MGLGVLPLLLACVVERPHPERTVVVVQEQQASWIRNFNPFVPTSARWPTSAGVYEPLMIYNQAQGRWEGWLATEHSWSEDARELRFRLREGVRWSDGQPFDAEDVVFTFSLMRREAGLDLGGVWAFLEAVEADPEDPAVVRFRFQRPYVSGLSAVAQQAIVPEHLWRDIEAPLLFQNESPVGTGPFTEVRGFRSQQFELGANPYYWQPLGVDALQLPALSSNEQANLALIRGELDWAGMFVPAVERVYEARDPEHFHTWFPTRGETIYLYANTTVAPLDDRRVREALSLAIDRELLVEVAMYGYTEPAHPSGLSQGFAGWIDPELEGGWVHLDRGRAEALLDEAGLRVGPDGLRTRPDGSPLTLTLTSPAGWSDWVRAIQVIAGELRKVGLDVRVAGYDFSAWYEQLSRGDFELSLGWSESGASPVPMYRGLMEPAGVKPVGEASFRNWHRFGSERARPLFEAFDATPDPEEQRRLAHALEALFIEEVPAIPLFPAPSWGEASTRYVTGFPSAEDPYALLSPNAVPGCLLVMTRLEAR